MKSTTRPRSPLSGLNLIQFLLLSAAPISSLASAVTTAASDFKCSEITADGHTWDLSKLGGPHSVITSEFDPPTYYNTTYTVDICAPLKRKGDVPKEEQDCNGGETRVCRIRHRFEPGSGDKEKGGKDVPENVTPIAGTSGDFVVETKRLKTSEAKEDEGKEGLRLTLKGPVHQVEQKAVITFLCDDKKEGTEGEWENKDDEYEKPGKKQKREDKKDGDDKKDDGSHGYPEKQMKKDDAALIWDGYKAAEGTLFLTWHTKYACEAQSGGGGKDGDKEDPKKPDEDAPASESSHWGFFTWLVVL